MVNVVCAVPECSNTLPKGQRKFCSTKCRQLVDKRKSRAKEKGEVYISPEIVTPIRIEELFLKALQQSIEEDKRKGK